MDGEPVPYRRKLDKNKSAVLKTLKDLLESKSITLHVYIQNVIKSYNFHALEYKEQKKQKANISSDSSMSDLDLSDESSSESE